MSNAVRYLVFDVEAVADAPLALDFGISLYPEDGENKESLIRIADERLYEFKKASRTDEAAPSRVIPMEPAMGRDAEQAPAQPAAPAKARAATAAATAAVKVGAERRKWERVSMVGTRAYAVIHDAGDRTARVLDLSYGGVGLHFGIGEEAPKSFDVVLHVPILPPVRVSLSRTYVHSADEAGTRIGCSFVS